MRFFSPLLQRVVYPCLAATGYFRRQHGATGPAIITYHGVLPAGYHSDDKSLDGSLVTAEQFRRQLSLLKAEYQVVSPEDFLLWMEKKLDLPPRSVLLTCDDGLLNTLTDMLPILQAEGLSCLFFVTAASAGISPRTLWYEDLYRGLTSLSEGEFRIEISDTPFQTSLGDPTKRRAEWWRLVQEASRLDPAGRQRLIQDLFGGIRPVQEWQENLSNHPALRRRFNLLNRSELQQLVAAGMTIGAHTVSHPVLSRMPDELAWREIAASKQVLEEAIGRAVWALAYPFGEPGSVTPREIEMAKRATYKCAFLNFGGGWGATMPGFELPRVHVTADMTRSQLEAHVSGFHRVLRGRFVRSEEIHPGTDGIDA